jgi:hypothetical protein
MFCSPCHRIAAWIPLVQVACINLSFFFTLSTSFPDALVKTAPSSSLHLPCSAATSAISFSTSPLWDLTLRRKVAAPAETQECSRCMISVRMSASLLPWTSDVLLQSIWQHLGVRPRSHTDTAKGSGHERYVGLTPRLQVPPVHWRDLD